jgi:hypothetical protein
MGVSGFVSWTAPMFLLFLQEINSERRSLCRRNPGLFAAASSKKQRIYSPPWGNLPNIDQNTKFRDVSHRNGESTDRIRS